MISLDNSVPAFDVAPRNDVVTSSIPKFILLPFTGAFHYLKPDIAWGKKSP